MSPKKKLILEHAAALFREKGYAASSMRDLAERVGIEPSSLYNHISSKSDILREICMSNAKKYLEGMELIRSSGEGPSMQLRKVIQLHISIATEDNSSETVFNDEWKHLDPESLSAFRKMRKRYEDSLISILEEGVYGGWWHEHNVKVLMYSILSSVRWVHQFYRRPEMGNPEQLAEEIASIWLKGIDKCPC